MDRFENKLIGGIHKIFDSIEREIGSFGRDAPHSPPQPSLDLSNISTFYRYRKQRGVNLGSWFVLERWISQAPFREAKAPGQSDLDVAKGSNAKQILEGHWDSWITDQDWQYLSSKGINAVRLPIGYYHLCGGDASVLEKTHFQDMYSVFCGAWPRIISAIQTALRFGIGVLLDLHAAPGKQNHDSHGGTSKKPAFFDSSRHRDHTIHVLCTIIRLLNNAYPNIVGIELLNEPAPPSDSLLKEWYSDACMAMSRLDSSIPLYLGECWQTNNYFGYIQSERTTNMLVLDHHLYRCFTHEDIHISAHDHAGALRDPNNPIVKTLARVGQSTVIGEWSAALNPGSLEFNNDIEHRVFANAQLDLFERTCAGWFFWTYKKDGWDNGWSFRDVQSSEVLPGWLGGMRGRIPVDASNMKRRDSIGSQVQSSHVNWWKQHSGDYHHERFGHGFTIGWDDSYAFFKSVPIGLAVPEIGFKAEWARRRSGDGYWEFEHGFNQGVYAAREDFGKHYC